MNTFDIGMASSWRALRRVALVALVGIAAGAAAFAQPHHHRGDSGPGMMMWGGRHLDRALDAVNASDAQRTQIKQITDAAVADLKAQHQATRDLRQQMMQAFTQPTVDANTVEALRQKMLAQHDQASRRMMQAMLDVSRVLTPEQRATLAERMQQRRSMMERHMQERRQLDPKQ